ncbi:unnamed protein product [Rotaria magnacalcarata]|uniref:NACHT domain-containing protein n=1 Tax=Rotaria magnacalcarata TaxID=392030 RepID=A0A816X9F6_9BILA|nr:unnamed protein product [Rotaria magnacalcarata]
MVDVVSSGISALGTAYTVITTIIDFIETIEGNAQEAELLIKRIERMLVIIDSATKDTQNLLSQLKHTIDDTYNYAIEFKRDNNGQFFPKQQKSYSQSHRNQVAPDVPAVVLTSSSTAEQSTEVETTDSNASCCSKPGLFRWYRILRIKAKYKSIKQDFEQLNRKIDEATTEVLFGINVDTNNRVKTIDRKIDQLKEGQDKLIDLVLKPIGAREQVTEEQKSKVIEKLKKEYRDKHGTVKRFSTEVDIPISQHYINVAIVEKISNTQERNMLNNFGYSTFEEVYGPKTQVEIKKLLDKTQQESSGLQRVLVLGRAGIGKTTFCRYIAHEWADGKLLCDTKCVIYIKLRNLMSMKYKPPFTLVDIVQTECFPTEELSTVDNELIVLREILNETNNVLWLLDGYDEYNVPVDTELDSIFQKILLKKRQILTSRPNATIPNKYDAQLEIIGFTDENIDGYVENFFTLNDAEKSRRLISFIKSTPTIWGICHVPITLEILCTLWIDHETTTFKSEQMSISVLYTKIVTWILRKFLINREGKAITDKKTDRKVNVECDQIVFVLEKIAFLSMQSSCLIINSKILQDISNECSDTPNNGDAFREEVLKVGLLVALESKTSVKAYADYYFIHLSFQEFLAARYLNRLLSKNDEEAIRFLKFHKYSPRLQLTLTFTAGVLEGENVEKFFDILTGMPVDFVGVRHFLLVTGCLEEIDREKHRTIADRLLTTVQLLIKYTAQQRSSAYYMRSTHNFKSHNDSDNIHITDHLRRCYGLLHEKQIEKLLLKLLKSQTKQKAAYTIVCDLKKVSTQIFDAIISNLNNTDWGSNEVLSELVFYFLTDTTNVNTVRKLFLDDDEEWIDNFVRAATNKFEGRLVEKVLNMLDLINIPSTMIEKILLKWTRTMIRKDVPFDSEIHGNLSSSVRRICENCLLSDLESSRAEVCQEAINFVHQSRNDPFHYKFQCFDQIDQVRLLTALNDHNISDKLKNGLTLSLSLQIEQYGVSKELLQMLEKIFLQEKDAPALLLLTALLKTPSHLTQLHPQTIDKIIARLFNIYDSTGEYDTELKIQIIKDLFIFIESEEHKETVWNKLREILRNPNTDIFDTMYVLLSKADEKNNLKTEIIENIACREEKIKAMAEYGLEPMFHVCSRLTVDIISKYETWILSLKDEELVLACAKVLRIYGEVSDDLVNGLLVELRACEIIAKQTLIILSLRTLGIQAYTWSVAQELIRIIENNFMSVEEKPFIALFIALWETLGDKRLLHEVLKWFNLEEKSQIASQLLQEVGFEARMTVLLDQLIVQGKNMSVTIFTSALSNYCAKVHSLLVLIHLFKLAKKEESTVIKDIIEKEIDKMCKRFENSMWNSAIIKETIDPQSGVQIIIGEYEEVNTDYETLIDNCRLLSHVLHRDILKNIRRLAQRTAIAITYDHTSKTMIVHGNDEHQAILFENECTIKELEEICAEKKISF